MIILIQVHGFTMIFIILYIIIAMGWVKKKFLTLKIFINLLEQKKKDDPEFSYITNVDLITNELKSVIWMSREQKMSYSQFNDIIVYDNTYKCNRFSMPF